MRFVSGPEEASAAARLASASIKPCTASGTGAASPTVSTAQGARVLAGSMDEAGRSVAP